MLLRHYRNRGSCIHLVRVIVSSEKKFIFVAVPKTGSSSTEKALAKYSDEELEKGKTKHTMLRHIPHMLDEPYYKFCFFRNPWDRMVSFYHYHLRQGDQFLSRDYEDITFKEWIEKGITAGTFEKQTSYIMNKGRIVPNVSIYKFEEMDDSWEHICKTLNVEGELPHINKSKHKHYSEYYDDETRHAVKILEYGAIRMMNYEFEEI